MKLLNKLKRKKNIKPIIIAVFFIASAIIWTSIKVYDHYYISTDDAYVNANVVQMAPRITGQVINTYVSDNQYVHQNQPLFKVDSLPFEIAIAKFEAQLAINQAALINAQAKADRTMQLAQKKYVSPQTSDNVKANLESAQAAYQLAKAAVQQARLNLSWTTVQAPTSGWVTNFKLRNGDLVAANQPFFALISDGEFWIDTNFKETQLGSIKPGQLATIKVDMYPDHTFQGVVESISGGTGAAFSLLPPQNATGNWVKVTQRVPVRVRVLNPDNRYPLRIGTSATVTISLRHFYQQPQTH